MAKAAGVSVVLVATGTVACGLLMLAGVGPAPAGAETGEPAPAIESQTSPDDPYGPPSSSTLAPVDDTTTTTTTTTTTATTTTTSTAATTTTMAPTTTTTPSVVPSPVPLTVSPDTVWVGPGGTARISGTCASSGGVPLGPVEIWQVGAGVTVIPTNVTATAWTYEWTAPSTIEPLVLQPWCGSPVGFTGGFPASLQVEVVFVAQDPPPTTTTPESVAPGDAGDQSGAIPETD